VSFDLAKDFRLDGKAALVTGGTRGIGRAIAEAYVAAGASVCVLARKPDELSETQEALTALGGHATTYAGSAGDPEAIAGAVEHCLSDLGGVDILVNNAATNPSFGPLIDIEPRVMRKILEVNIEGPVLLAQAAWRAWMRDHGGVIINVASVGGLRPSIGIGMYNTSKAALIHLTRQLAGELGPSVRVNALAPGLVKTHFARALYEHDEEGLARGFPMKRLGVPDDIAGAALFLASDASAWLTGDVLVVDGGMTVSGA
jgi:NAD(P)-dependent dehydrogenase (short-subunit alcohol dehydrogenase family)